MGLGWQEGAGPNRSCRRGGKVQTDGGQFLGSGKAEGKLLWNWLKKRRYPDNNLRALAEQLIGPQSLATALAETVRDYVAAVKSGKLAYPAHRREGASVVEIWADLRLEALHKLFNFGQSDPFLLSDFRRQEELLSCLLDDRAHLEMPQPRGVLIPDTVQAMFQVYLYLGSVGSEVTDCQTDRAGLKLEGKSILDQIELGCAEERPKWAAFRAGTPTGKVPQTILELLYTDVTAKAKSIALSAKFGPSHEGGIRFVEGLLANQSDDVKAFRASVSRILTASDPDHLSNNRSE